MGEEATEKEAEETQELEDEESIEQVAMKIGWNPNHEGGDRETLSAADFILKSREIQDTSSKTLKKQGREMAELKNAIKALGEHNKSLYQAQVAALKKEQSDLKIRRKEAKEDDDDSLVRELDDQLDQINKVPSELPEATTAVDPRFSQWLDNGNEWYEDDEELRVYADVLAEQPKYKALITNDYTAGLKKIEEVVKQMWPQKFERSAPSPGAPSVEGGTRRKTTSRKSKYKYSDLSREQQDLADTYERHGVMKKEEYIRQLTEIEAAR